MYIYTKYKKTLFELFFLAIPSFFRKDRFWRIQQSNCSSHERLLRQSAKDKTSTAQSQQSAGVDVSQWSQVPNPLGFSWQVGEWYRAKKKPFLLFAADQWRHCLTVPCSICNLSRKGVALQVAGNVATWSSLRDNMVKRLQIELIPTFCNQCSKLCTYRANSSNLSWRWSFTSPCALLFNIYSLSPSLLLLDCRV